MDDCVIVKFTLDRFTSIWYCRTHDTKLCNATEIGRHVTCPQLIYLDIDNNFNLEEVLPDAKPRFEYTFTFNEDTNELVIEIDNEEEIDPYQIFEQFKESVPFEEFEQFCVTTAIKSLEEYLDTKDIMGLSHALFHLEELYSSLEEENT